MRRVRLVAFLLFLCVLLAPLAFSTPRLVRQTTSGGQPGELELRIITPHQSDIRQTYARAFSDWHRARFGAPVHLTFVTPGGTSEIVRYLRGHYEVTRTDAGFLPPEAELDIGLDLFWGGGDVFEREVKGYLKPMNLPRSVLTAAFPSVELAGVPLVDPDTDASFAHLPVWVGLALSSFGIVYNPQVYATLQLPAPKTWDDLALPKLDQLLSLPDPTQSGSAMMTYMMVLQSHMEQAEQQYLAAKQRSDGAPPSMESAALDPQYASALDDGWARGIQTLVLMGANSRYFSDNASRSANDVGQADTAAGVAIDFYARVYQDAVGAERIVYLAPRAATAITPDPIAILYGTLGPHELLANRFIEFCLSSEGQRLWNLRPNASPYVTRALRRLPVRRDVYQSRSEWTDDIDPFKQVGTFNLRAAWLSGYSETRMLLATLWLDSGSAMQSAHRAVQRVNDERRRQELRAQLAQVPITRQEVYALQARRKQAEGDPTQSARLLLSQQRSNWANRFRAHFQRVEDQAGRAQ